MLTRFNLFTICTISLLSTMNIASVQTPEATSLTTFPVHFANTTANFPVVVTAMNVASSSNVATMNITSDVFPRHAVIVAAPRDNQTLTSLSMTMTMTPDLLANIDRKLLDLPADVVSPTSDFTRDQVQVRPDSAVPIASAPLIINGTVMYYHDRIQVWLDCFGYVWSSSKFRPSSKSHYVVGFEKVFLCRMMLTIIMMFLPSCFKIMSSPNVPAQCLRDASSRITQQNTSSTDRKLPIQQGQGQDMNLMDPSVQHRETRESTTADHCMDSNSRTRPTIGNTPTPDTTGDHHMSRESRTQPTMGDSPTPTTGDHLMNSESRTQPTIGSTPTPAAPAQPFDQVAYEIGLRNAFGDIGAESPAERSSRIASPLKQCETPEELSMQYRELSLAYHPDRRMGEKAVFLEIKKEYFARKQDFKWKKLYKRSIKQAALKARLPLFQAKLRQERQKEFQSTKDFIKGTNGSFTIGTPSRYEVNKFLQETNGHHVVGSAFSYSKKLRSKLAETSLTKQFVKQRLQETNGLYVIGSEQ